MTCASSQHVDHDTADGVGGALVARSDLVAAARSLIDRAIHGEADPERFRAAIALIEQANHALGAPLRRETQRLPTSRSDQEEAWDPGQFLTSHLVYGPEHPFAPDLVAVSVDGSTLTGRACYSQVYEGPAGLVHGGVIAAIFDGLQATVASVGAQGAALTHTLTIRYKQGTPIDREVDLYAAVDRVEGRKVFTVASISLDGEVTAESTGFFVCR